jgi:hypothetical protein
MAPWSLTIGPDTKAAVTAALNAAVATDVLSADPPGVFDFADSTFVGHFAAAKAAAQAVVAALVGNAPNIRVYVRGYVDRDSAKPLPFAAGSKLEITAIEFWHG